jgi:Tol biopolymer transport system component
MRQGRLIMPSIGLVLACASLAACGTSSTDGGRLALFRVAPKGFGARYDIVTADARGRNLRVVVGDSLRHQGARPGLFDRPVWSPDGHRIAFTGDVARHPGRDSDTGTETDIFVVNVDGSGLRRLTRTRRSSGPLWSPDGRRIVFAMRARGQPFSAPVSLWVMRGDGSAQRRLEPDLPGRIDVPGSFSPDGSLLAFTRSRPPHERANGFVANTAAIYLTRLDGSRARQLEARSSAPAFSPDGRQIAFASDRDQNGTLDYGETITYANELYLVGVDGRHPRRLTKTRELNEGSPSWSPDGQRIAYERGEVVQNAQGFVVLVARPDGRCPTPVLADPKLDTWYSNPTWRPTDAGVRPVSLRC